MKNKLKEMKIYKQARKIYREIRYGELPKFEKLLYFLDNSSNKETMCFILAGYKQFTWDIIFKRIKKFCSNDIDICIVSSGLYSNELKNIATKNRWSYISMEKNCVTLALNSAIQSFPNVKKIFKIDEDIFITDGFFENLPKIYEYAKKDYFPCFSAPLIPINGYGYRRILEKLNLVKKYTDLFEYPKVSAGNHMQIESNPDVAKFFWCKNNFIPQIDMLNKIMKEDFIQTLNIKAGSKYNGGGYTICPIRFSIGAIYFEKEILENASYFPVKKGSCMGLDEEFLCNLATTKSKTMIISESQVVGHLSFGKQNDTMKEYFLNNKNIFEIKEF